MRIRRGVLEVGPYELDLQALVQSPVRPVFVLVLLSLFLFLLGWIQPWKLLRGTGTLQVVAPPGITWSVDGHRGNGSGLIPVRAGRHELRAGGDMFIPRTVPVQVSEATTTSVVLEDALGWLSSGVYSGTYVYFLWPRPSIRVLPGDTKRISFSGDDLIYETESGALYLWSGDEIQRLAWLEVTGPQLWAPGPQGKIAFARGQVVYQGTGLADISPIYTASLEISDLQRLSDSWLIVLREALGQGWQRVLIGDDGRITVLPLLGKEARIVGELNGDLLILREGSLYQVGRKGEARFVGKAWEGRLPVLPYEDHGTLYWLGPDLSTEAEGLGRAVWRAAASGPAVQVTRGVDACAVLGVRGRQVYYVFVRAGAFYIARKNEDGSGYGEVLHRLDVGGTEIRPSRSLRRWLVYDAGGKQYFLLDFGRAP